MHLRELNSFVFNRFSCTKRSNCQSILDAIRVNVLEHEHDDLSPVTHISEFWWNGSTFGFLFFLFYEYYIFRRASQVTFITALYTAQIRSKQLHRGKQENKKLMETVQILL